MSGSAAEVALALRAKHQFLLTSHARPDGDAIGSSLALAFALESLGKSVRVVFHDPVPAPYRAFPGTDRIEIADDVDGPADAAVLLECSDVRRPDVAGLDRYTLINVDHHAGNAMYGAVNWFDGSAAACGEMVADIIDALGVPWTREIAAHLYLAISTDTGSFRYGPITARTFDACRRIALTGVDLVRLSRQIFDSFGVGRVRLMGALLDAMELYHSNRLAVLYLDDELLASTHATADDVEGLVNLPLAAQEVVTAAFFKRQPHGTFRVSLRSKGDVDVRAVASRWGGGGHTNAAGCTLTGEYASVKQAIVDAIAEAIGQVKTLS
jgi:bifunctional oligoribonuclease and PAP phosphatase NrnA